MPVRRGRLAAIRRKSCRTRTVNHRHRRWRIVPLLASHRRDIATVAPRRPSDASARGAKTPSETWRSACGWSLLSGLLLWAAFAPLAWWPLAWIAPVGWLILVRAERLPGRRPYLAMAVAALLHWLAVLQGIRLAHPALYVGWFALSAYLAAYLVLFVALSRVAVHLGRVPLRLAAPTVWTGLEWVRGHAITGFSMALLGHTQTSRTALLQIADTFGAYGVSFVVMFVAACICEMLPWGPRAATAQGRWRNVGPAISAALMLTVVTGYGVYRQRSTDPSGSARPPLRVALIQGSFDTIFEFDPQRDRRVFQRYRELTEQAIADHPDVQLVVWPESMFSGDLGELLVDAPIGVPAGLPISADEYRLRVQAQAEAFAYKVQQIARQMNVRSRATGAADDPGVYAIVGTETARLREARMQRYNTALCIGPSGRIEGRYYKMHRVMFGEYIPWGDRFPVLYRLTPMTLGLEAGHEPSSFRVANWILAPSVCFESTVPHLIRRQVRTLRERGTAPNALVNVTNDGWFWGSGILDLQLACAVFRAIENRLPLLVAANTGISAIIDSNGRIQQQAGRRAEAILYGEIRAADRSSWYQRIGDAPVIACAVFCLVMAIFGLRTRPTRNKAERPDR